MQRPFAHLKTVELIFERLSTLILCLAVQIKLTTYYGSFTTHSVTFFFGGGGTKSTKLNSSSYFNITWTFLPHNLHILSTNFNAHKGQLIIHCAQKLIQEVLTNSYRRKCILFNDNSTTLLVELFLLLSLSMPWSHVQGQHIVQKKIWNTFITTSCRWNNQTAYS